MVFKSYKEKAKCELSLSRQAVLNDFQENYEQIKASFTESAPMYVKKELESMTDEEKGRWVKNEFLLEHSVMVEEIKLERVTGEWVAKIRDSTNELIVIEFNKSYVKNLLTERIMHKVAASSKHSNNFHPLHLYDRKGDWIDADFKRVRRVPGENCYELMDGNGRPAFATMRWAKENLAAGCLRDAHAAPSQCFVRCEILGSSSRNPKSASSCLPSIQYRNKGGACIANSLASALHGQGFEKEGMEMAQRYRDGAVPNDSWQERNFIKLIHHVMQTSGCVYRLRKLRGKDFKDGLDENLQRSTIVIASIEGKLNGKRVGLKHCVCFVGQLVYDCNMKSAMPLNRATMDLICDNIKDGATYDKILWSRELILKPARTAAGIR
jgi:hypothetical protein